METIRKKVDFDSLYNKGETLKGLSAKVIYDRSDKENEIWFAIVTPKRLGRAVERNRAKRRFKEILKNNSWSWEKGYKFIIIPNKVSLNLIPKRLRDDVKNMLERAQIVK